MSTTIDEKVVKARFDNAQFEKGVKATMASLDHLKAKLDLKGASKGLENVSAAAGKVNLGTIGTAVDGILAKFNTLSIVGIAALTNIANKAVDAGLRMLKGFTIDPILTGMQEYEQTLDATQTIMSGTGESVAQVTKTLAELNEYSDRTIYSFSDMTSNIKHFTNAGLSSAKAASTMKGIANAAAAAGANAQQAGQAMYGFGQSMSMGFIGLQDWNQIDNAGIATKEFKEELIKAGLAAGTLKKGMDGTIKTTQGTEVNFKNLRTTLQDQWATSEVLVDTLNKYSDASTKVGKKAQENATRVKTLTQLMGVLKESVQSGWSESWRLIIGDLGQASKLWTSVNEVVGGFIGRMAEARNKVLGDWAKLGGRTHVIEGIKNIFEALVAVIKPVSDAFKEIFPPKTGKDLAEISKSFREFTEGLKIGAETSSGLKSTFKGLFAIFSIAGKIIGGVLHYVTSLFGLLTTGTGSVWTLTGSVGDLIVKLNEWLEKGKYIEKFFDHLATARAAVLKPIIDFISRIVHAIGTLISGDTDGFFNEIGNSVKAFIPLAETFEEKFNKIHQAVKAVYDLVVKGDFTSGFREAFGIEEDMPIVDKILSIRSALIGIPAAIKGFFSGFLGGDATKATANVDNISNALENSAKVGDAIRSGWDSIVESFKSANVSLENLGKAVGPVLDAIKKKFGDFFSNLGVQDGLALVNTGFFIAFYTMMRKFLKNVNGLVDSLKGSFDSISGVLDQVTDNLKTMQTDVRADIILKIAASLGLLAVAIAILASIDPGKLAVALGAVSIMLGELIGALILLEKYTTFKGAVQMTLLSVALTGLGIAMLALAAAVAIFGTMEWGTLLKGLGSMAAVLLVLTGASALLDKTGGTKRLLVLAAALGILAFSLTAFAGAVKLYEAIDPATLLNGGLKIAGVMVAIGIAMRAFPKNMLQSAAALLIVSGALVVLAGAMKAFSMFDGGDVATSLIMLAGSLRVIATALRLMEGTLKGSAALLVAVGAISMLVPMLILLGQMDLQQVGIALGALAVALGLVVGAGALAVYVAPGLLVLGQAIALMGLGALAAGAGLLAFSAGLTALAASGAAGVAVMIGAIVAVAQIFPLIMQQVALGIIAFAKVISESGPVLVAALTTLIISLIQAIRKAIPEFGKTMTVFILTMLQVINTVAPRIIDTLLNLIWKLVSALVNNVPKFVDAGLRLINGILRGFADNIPKVVNTVGDLISRFIRALGDNGIKIIKAGAETILKFLNSLSAEIRKQGPAFGRAGGDILAAIVEGLVGGVGAFAGTLWNAAQRIAGSFMDGIKSFFGIASPSKEMKKIGTFVMQGFRQGLDGSASEVQKSFDNLKRMLGDSIEKLDKDIVTLQARMKKLQSARKKDYAEIRKTNSALKQARAERTKVGLAMTLQTKLYRSEGARLKSLANQYDKLTTKIDEANKKLADATKTRDDYAKSIKDQFNDLPDISADETVASFAGDLRKQISDTKLFATALQRLRENGLNDTLYKELLAKGPAAMPFISDLVNAGTVGVKELNALSDELAKVSGSLGTQAGSALYQAAVDSAAGLVKGLQNQQRNIEIQMDKIADAMVRAIKSKLGIRSPSRVFAEIGKFTSQGLATGMEKYKNTVEDASESVGHAAIESMRKTISGLSDIVDDNMDLNPVISPVLDLTDVERNAGKIGSLIPAGIGVGASYFAAKKAQAAYHANDNAFDSEGVPFQEVHQETTFIQNNHSPKALSNGEIYRQTKSLISAKKGEVNP